MKTLWILIAVSIPANAFAAIIPPTIPIPDSEVLEHNGLDWIYAGPTQPGSWGMQPPEYRESEGWRYASDAEWALRPTWQEFTRPGFDVPWDIEEYDDHEAYRFTTAYWTDEWHFVDLIDAENGFIWSGPKAPDNAHEAWYVRDSAVPEPASYVLAVLMVILFCLAGRLIYKGGDRNV